MIGRANETMLPCLKHIWQTCFDDTPQGTDFVFSHLLHPQQMLVYTPQPNQPVAMINWKLLPFTTPTSTLMGAYIFGVATLPQYRGKGISRQMMSHLHQVLQQEGAALSCLVPASASLFSFYSAQDFEPFFFYRLAEVAAEEIKAASHKATLTPTSLERLEPVRNQAFAGRRLFGAWDTGYLQFAQQENAFYGGETLEFSCQGRTGYAVCQIREKDTLLVRELVVDPQDVDTLLAALHQRFGAKGYQLRLPVDFPGQPSGKDTPFAMIKWYDQSHSQSTSGEPGGAPWFAFGLD
ncbi:MAG: GNAT family N-acetyltransferase [Oscillospiraceae bacterium]|jgi:predicted acetyltransferase